MYHESRGVPYSLADPPLEVLPHPGPSSCLHRHLVAHGSHCHFRRGSAGGPSPEKIAWGSLKELRNSSEIQLTRLKRQAAAGGGVGTGGHGRQESKERERS